MRVETIQQEIDVFQRQLNEAMPWGASLRLVDERYEPLTSPGAVELLASCATVLSASVGVGGVFYNVAFGPPDEMVDGAEQPDDLARPLSWTLVLTDPFVEFPDGRFALETLSPGGDELVPAQWLMAAPIASPQHLLATTKGVL